MCTYLNVNQYYCYFLTAYTYPRPSGETSLSTIILCSSTFPLFIILSLLLCPDWWQGGEIQKAHWILMQANLACMLRAMSAQVCQSKVFHDLALAFIKSCCEGGGWRNSRMWEASDGWKQVHDILNVMKEWPWLKDTRLVRMMGFI